MLSFRKTCTARETSLLWSIESSVFPYKMIFKSISPYILRITNKCPLILSYWINCAQQNVYQHIHTMVNHWNKRIHNQNLLLNNIFSRQHLNPESRSNVIVSIWLIFKHSTIFTSDALLICMVLLRLGEQIIKIATKSLWYWHYKSFIRFDLDYGVWRHLQQYFRYIVAVTMSGIRTHNVTGDRHWLIAQVIVNPTTIRPRRFTY